MIMVNKHQKKTIKNVVPYCGAVLWQCSVCGTALRYSGFAPSVYMNSSPITTMDWINKLLLMELEQNQIQLLINTEDENLFYCERIPLPKDTVRGLNALNLI